MTEAGTPVDPDLVNKPRPRVLVLTGTTASGKNRTGAVLAEKLDGEVLVLDSMKVYRGMDVGTDKPGPKLRGRIPHHLIDILDPSEEMNLHRYVSEAHRVAAEVASRGKLPIVVGGTALYLNGFLRGIVEGVPKDEEFRARFREEVAREGLAIQHARLAQLDPAAAAKIHPNDQMRIERALEVYTLTGRPFSEQQSQWERPPLFEHLLFVLTWPRDLLYRRIDERVDDMFSGKLQDEVARIEAAGGFGLTAREAIGYKEALELHAGTIDLEGARTRTQHATHRFARKQMTWFRSMKDAEWIEGVEGQLPRDLAEPILSAWQRFTRD